MLSSSEKKQWWKRHEIATELSSVEVSRGSDGLFMGQQNINSSYIQINFLKFLKFSLLLYSYLGLENLFLFFEIVSHGAHARSERLRS